MVVDDRWERAGRVAGHAAAVAMTPYLLIKASWVVGSLLGVLPTGADLGLAEWVAVNTITMGMAATAIAVALALVRPWGERLPGRALVAFSWLGAGFLVPVLPYAVAGLATIQDDGEMPVWEGVLIQGGFIGMGLGLAVALPAYFHRRWPAALDGRLGDHPLRDVPTALAVTVLAVPWGVWAVQQNAMVVLLAAWAAAGVVASWCLATGRPASWPRWPVLALAWLGSGSLFAWSAWKLPISAFVETAGPPWANLLGLLAGVLMLRSLLVGGGAR